jgi:Holliday junction resolvase
VKYFANRNTRAGVPDILACVNGRFVAIEVKAENGKPTELQKWNVEQIQNSGGIALILYPVDWERFVDLINRLQGRCLNASEPFKN